MRAPRLAEVAVAALASRRLVQLIQEDTITEPIRSKFYRVFPADGTLEQATTSDWVPQWDAALGQETLQVVMRDVTRPSSKRFTPIGDGSGNPIGWTAPKGTFLGNLVACPRCLGVWTAAAILIAQRSRRLAPLAAVMAVAGAVRVFEDVNDKIGARR